MDRKRKELISILDQIIQLLNDDGKIHWFERISDYRDRISNSDYYAIEDLLSDYGGMGSFNDLVLGYLRENGKNTWKDNANQLNEQLRILQSRAFALATDINMNNQLD
jgi:hypothetical protein